MSEICQICEQYFIIKNNKKICLNCKEVRCYRCFKYFKYCNVVDHLCIDCEKEIDIGHKEIDLDKLIKEKTEKNERILLHEVAPRKQSKIFSLDNIRTNGPKLL